VLNLKYLGKNQPTDVLSFDSSGAERKCADIIISTQTAIRNAKAFKTTPLFELNLYLVHGLLHILGYDDKTHQQRKLIRRKEKQYVYPTN